jgi:polysaccharide export outer membrane protein
MPKFVKEASGYVAGVVLAALLAGCAGLPTAGPLAIEVVNEETSGTADFGNFVIVDVDERVASIWASQPRDTLRVFSDYRPAPDTRIGIGDSVVVTIWEAAAGGLFSAAPTDKTITAGSRTAMIPEQVVPQDGTIQVPYAGRIRVNGLRPADVERAIVEQLKGKAIEPQAVVTITKNVSNVVTVSGEVVAGARVPLSARGDRLLDVIASAGGLRAAAHETFIRLTRGGKTISVAYNTLLSDPQENIFVRPDDVVTVIKLPQTYTTFGSTGKNAVVPFDAVGITLEEAIAKTGGLVDDLADPGGVFVLRFEPAGLVKQLSPERVLPSDGNLIPVVYRLNLREAKAYFLARAFQIKDKDIVYVAPAPSVPVRKFLQMVGQVVAPAVSVTRVVQ